MDDYRNNINSLERGVSLSKHLVSVYGWMFFGLVITGIMSIMTYVTPLRYVLTNRILFFGIIILEFVVVISFTKRVMKQSYVGAVMSFVFYAILNGITISIIFLAYDLVNITVSFFVAALFFGVMSLFGLFTKSDLTSWGNVFFMGLIGIIIATIFNIFIGSDTLSYMISYIGVAVFLGLTAYDNQKIKRMYHNFAGTEKEKNIAVVGALMIYLDFINLFLFILRIFGRRR